MITVEVFDYLYHKTEFYEETKMEKMKFNDPEIEARKMEEFMKIFRKKFEEDYQKVLDDKGIKGGHEKHTRFSDMMSGRVIAHEEI